MLLNRFKSIDHVLQAMPLNRFTNRISPDSMFGAIRNAYEQFIVGKHSHVYAITDSCTNDVHEMDSPIEISRLCRSPVDLLKRFLSN